MFYHTSERSLFTKSDNLTPISNQESFPSVTIEVSMGCLIVVIFFLILSVCLLYRKNRRLREYVEGNRYLSCALKHTNDSGNKTSSDNEGGEIKIALTIFKKKVFFIKNHNVFPNHPIKRRHTILIFYLQI